MDNSNKNTKLFALFRVFFNCRFYYPIYLVMFLDFGLTISEFATLNLIWAVAIILLEVPSGALADHIGRKRLVILSAILMVGEISVLIFTPVGSSIVFWMFVINRILSGAAEAAADPAARSCCSVQPCAGLAARPPPAGAAPARCRPRPRFAPIRAIYSRPDAPSNAALAAC